MVGKENMKEKRLTVGILGGMGARASVRFYEEVIRACTNVFGVGENEEFPRLLIANLPIPDIVGSTAKKDLAERLIIEGGQDLQRAGADCLIMACNTAHVCFGALQDAVNIPVLNLIEETVAAVPDSVNTVGVLATPTTLQTGLYQKALSQAGFDFVLPDRQEEELLEAVILAAIADQNGEAETIALVRAMERMKLEGAEAIILGCTELGLVVGQNNSSLPLIDSVIAGAGKTAALGLGRDTLA